MDEEITEYDLRAGVICLVDYLERVNAQRTNESIELANGKHRTGMADLDKFLGGGFSPELCLVGSEDLVLRGDFGIQLATYALSINRKTAVFLVPNSEPEITEGDGEKRIKKRKNRYTFLADEYLKRATLIHSEVSLCDLNEGFLAERDFPRLTSSLGFFYDAEKNKQLRIYSGPQSASSIHRKCLEIDRNTGLDLILVSSLQNLFPIRENREFNSNYDAAREIGALLSDTAHETGAPVVVLSEMKSNLPRYAKKSPTIGDIREYGVLGEIAKPVLILREEEREEPGAGIATKIFVHCFNNLYGARRGIVEMLYIERFGAFKPLAIANNGE